MIVVDKRSWLSMVFSIRGSCLQTIWLRILVVTAFAVFVTFLEHMLGIQAYSLTPMPFSLIGLAMAIFLGFRNNAAYDRFWEGRKLWGTQVNTSRSFVRQILHLINANSPQESEQVEILRRRIARASIAFVHSFRHHLRGTSPTVEIEPYLSAADLEYLEGHSNLPSAILLIMGRMVRDAWKAGYIAEYHLPLLEAHLNEMTNVLGGCERIRNTPIPFSYSVLIHRLVAMYCFAMPLGLVESTGVLTPLAVALISYGFFGLDAIGDDVEQPFDEDENDLPLAAISRVIEINVLQAIGESDVPDPLKPINGVLL